jgi:serine/threonine protein phosphatase 1
MESSKENAMTLPVRENTDAAKAKPEGFAARIARFFSGAKRALLPEGVRVYAVGDIHGCAAELDTLMEKIRRDRTNWSGSAHLIFIGDYVDRGPDSKGVVERLLAPPGDFEICYLRGNHDQTLLDFLADPSVFGAWRDFGGRETLLSYGVMPPRFEELSAFEEARDRFQEALPQEHLAFFEGLPLFARIGGYFFAHAGVRPGVGLDRQNTEDLLWIREEFLFSAEDFGMVVVHGHTPSPSPVRRHNRIGIDTGAYATQKLTAAVLEGNGCRFLSS